jgi:hypothetical protein
MQRCGTEGEMDRHVYVYANYVNLQGGKTLLPETEQRDCVTFYQTLLQNPHIFIMLYHTAAAVKGASLNVKGSSGFILFGSWLVRISGERAHFPEVY